MEGERRGDDASAKAARSVANDAVIGSGVVVKVAKKRRWETHLRTGIQPCFFEISNGNIIFTKILQLPIALAWNGDTVVCWDDWDTGRGTQQPSTTMSPCLSR
jgi:hypothetical protein